MSKESLGKVFFVATAICVVCSIVVSAAAVALKPRQERNKALDLKANIVAAANLLEEGATGDRIEELYKQIEPKVVDLNTGEYVDIDPAEFDARKEAMNPESSTRLPPEDSKVGILRRPNHQVVYLVKKEGRLERLILPVYGKGLWSTMYGLIALDSDLNTVESFGFYEHAETPGLGGEVDNPNWKSTWVGKKVYDNGGPPAIRVIKGKVNPDAPNAEHLVDGLSGATLTGNGVTNTVDFWLGPNGFGPYLNKLKGGE